jgi:hypothetical protein
VREWWLRTVLVLQSPRAVFVALRSDEPEDLSARSEPILLIVLLSGIAFVLATRTAAHLMDDSDYDGLLVAVWAFLAGGLYGSVAYWLLGGLLHWSSVVLGSEGSFRRSRQVLAFSAVPVALSLVLWPVKLAIYRSALFHAGGSDGGSGGHVFAWLWVVFELWAASLLVIGVRSVHGWTWGRAALAAAPPVILCVLAALA